MGKGSEFTIETGTVRCEKYALPGGGFIYDILQQRGGPRLTITNLEIAGLRRLLDLVDAEDRAPGSAGEALVDGVNAVPPLALWKPVFPVRRGFRLALERRRA